MLQSHGDEPRTALYRALFDRVASSVGQTPDTSAPALPKPAPDLREDRVEERLAETHAEFYAAPEAGGLPGFAIAERRNSRAQQAAHAAFRQQQAHDCMRGMPLPHSHPVHDSLEEHELRRRSKEHAQAARGGISRNAKARIEGRAHVGNNPQQTQYRLQLLLAGELGKNATRAGVMRRHFAAQRAHVEALFARAYDRELGLRSLLDHRAMIDPRVLADLGAQRQKSPDVVNARIYAVVDHVLSGARTDVQYRQFLRYLPQLLQLLSSSAKRDAAFTRLRTFAQADADDLDNQALLVNLAESLPTIGHVHKKRRQLRALRSTRKPSASLLHALFEHIDALPDSEERDAELYEMLLAHLSTGAIPNYTFEEKMQTLIDRNLQNKILKAAGAIHN